MPQEVPKFHMLVGIPGSGKTTWSSEKTDCVVLSSDKIRQEMGLGFAQEDHTKLFAEITRRIIQHLQNKDNVIFDATNLNRKRRMALIKLINSDHKIGIVHNICELFITPPEVCIKRCTQRTGQPFVSPDVIRRMIKNFQVPSKYEGFDKINVHYSDDGLPYMFDTKDFDIPQDNHHHTESIALHCCHVADYFMDNDELFDVALYHDIGKRYTKVFQDSKGRPTQEAHYYNHENVSAYLYLCIRKLSLDNCEQSDILERALLINLHMLTHSWDTNEKMNKAIRFWGFDIVHKLICLYDAEELVKKGKINET